MKRWAKWYSNPDYRDPVASYTFFQKLRGIKNDDACLPVPYRAQLGQRMLFHGCNALLLSSPDMTRLFYPGLLALTLAIGLVPAPAAAQEAPAAPAKGGNLQPPVPLQLPADVLVYEIPSQQARPLTLPSRNVLVVQESPLWLRIKRTDGPVKYYYVARSAIQLRADETVAQFVARGGEALPSAAVANRQAALAAAEQAKIQEEKAHQDGLPRDSTTGRITFTEVVTVPGTSQADLYTRAHEWLAKRTNGTRPVLELQERENGKLIGKFALAVKPGVAVSETADLLRATLSLFCKEGRYKYLVTDFHYEKTIVGRRLDARLEETSPEGVTANNWQDVRLRTTVEMQRLVTDLKAAMSKKADSDF